MGKMKRRRDPSDHTQNKAVKGSTLVQANDCAPVTLDESEGDEDSYQVNDALVFAMQPQLEQLIQQWPERKTEIMYFSNLDRSRCTFYIHGPPSSGKTQLCMDYYSAHNTRHSYVDCVSCFSEQSVLVKIGAQVSSHLKAKIAQNPAFQGNNQTLEETVDDWSWKLPSEFLDNMRLLPLFGVNRFVMIFDRAERLADLGSGELFSILLNLEKIMISCLPQPSSFLFDVHPEERQDTMPAVSAVFISEIPWYNYSLRPVLKSSLCKEPLVLHLKKYSEQAIRSILIRKGKNISVQSLDAETVGKLYEAVVDLVLPWAFKATSDLRELDRLCRTLLPYYCRPLIEGRVPISNAQSKYLFADFQVYLKRATNCIYRQDVSLDAPGSKKLQDCGGGIPTDKFLASSSSSAVIDDYPKDGLILLLAAYFGSLCPPAQDSNNFQIFQAQAMKGRRSGAARASSSSKDTQTTFKIPLERLFGIYAALKYYMQDESDLSEYKKEIKELIVHTKTLAALSSLVSFGLLSCSDDKLSTLTYECKISDHMAKDIALKLDLMDEYAYYAGGTSRK